MSDLLTPLSLFGAAIALMFFATGGIIWMRHGMVGASFVWSKDFAQAKHDWETKCLTDDARLSRSDGQ